MNTTNSKNTLFSLFVASIVVVGLLGASYIWVFLEVRSEIAKVTVAAEEAQILATQNAHVQTVRRVVRDTQIQRETLSTYFLSEEEIVEFLEEIENLGTHAGSQVSVQTVQAGEAVDKDGAIIPLQLTLRSGGSLQAVFYTLALLESYPKALSVEEVVLIQNPTTFEWSGMFNVVAMQARAVENI